MERRSRAKRDDGLLFTFHVVGALAIWLVIIVAYCPDGYVSNSAESPSWLGLLL